MKIIRITNCKDCPFFGRRKPERPGCGYYCEETGQRFEEAPESIPDNCPLEDENKVARVAMLIP